MEWERNGDQGQQKEAGSVDGKFPGIVLFYVCIIT